MKKYVFFIISLFAYLQVLLTRIYDQLAGAPSNGI